MSRCIYTHPVKKLADIDHAYAHGVRTFVVRQSGGGAEVHRLPTRRRRPGAVGSYGSHSNVMAEDVHPPILALTELEGDGPAPPLEPATLAGPTCDSVDVVASDYPMPTLAVDDVVVSPVMGAYTAATSSRFNGVAKTPIVVVRSNHGLVEIVTRDASRVRCWDGEA